jgi:hypothetical protein
MHLDLMLRSMRLAVLVRRVPWCCCGERVGSGVSSRSEQLGKTGTVWLVEVNIGSEKNGLRNVGCRWEPFNDGGYEPGLAGMR